MAKEARVAPLRGAGGARIVTLELGGHTVGSADPADRLFAALPERQVDTLGLAGVG
uniref:Uncharacterized protein n=1 Tax=Janibacter limosus TaxID=53458 RepID=A0AC61U3K2_9MICO|nr:hypothetical protein [Janibacter limosus]